MKIILINTYPMDAVFKLWKQGLHPSHHLWGIVELQKNNNYEFIILQHEKYKVLNYIGRLFKIKFLDQQIRALWLLRKCDMIYAPYAAANTKLIIILKFLKIVKKPIIIIVHQPLLNIKSNTIVNFFIKKLILQYDSIIFLSDKLKNDLIERLAIPFKVYHQKFFNLDWGPDTNFYKTYLPVKDPIDTKFAISAGNTDRDFDTLIEAFKYINFPLKIYCTEHSLPKIKNIPKNVEIISKHISYFDLLKEYDKARLVLIPITNNPLGTQGLTGILDVVGMGKPVIMTKNMNVDLDIDKEIIGISVKQGNVEEWVSAVKLILNDYELLTLMSKNSLALGRNKFNMLIFSNELDKIFSETYKNWKK